MQPAEVPVHQMQVLPPPQVHWLRKVLTTYPLDMLFVPHPFGNFPRLAFQPVAVQHPSSLPPSHTSLGRPSTRLSASGLSAPRLSSSRLSTAGHHPISASAKHLPLLSWAAPGTSHVTAADSRSPSGPGPGGSLEGAVAAAVAMEAFHEMQYAVTPIRWCFPAV